MFYLLLKKNLDITEIRVLLYKCILLIAVNVRRTDHLDLILESETTWQVDSISLQII